MSRLPEIPVLCHEEDAIGLTSLDGLMSMYGLPEEIEEEFRKEVLEDFSYAPQSRCQHLPMERPSIWAE